jgi:hypothetical protein
MRLIQQNGVGDGWLERTSQGLDERSNRITTESMDQSAEFVAIASRHSLYGKKFRYLIK